MPGVSLTGGKVSRRRHQVLAFLGPRRSMSASWVIVGKPDDLKARRKAVSLHWDAPNDLLQIASKHA